MATVQEKSDRLAAVHRKLDQFIGAGGDLKTPTAVPLRQEFENAFKELFEEFGPAPEKPVRFSVSGKP